MMEEEGEEEVSSSTIESALLKLLNVLLKSESLGMNEGMELWSLSLSLSPPFITTITQCCRPLSIMMVESSISLASCT